MNAVAEVIEAAPADDKRPPTSSGTKPKAAVKPVRVTPANGKHAVEVPAAKLRVIIQALDDEGQKDSVPGSTVAHLANLLREQALAALYHRTGWTQDELAKVERVDRTTVARRILFGRFLDFVPSGHNGTKPPRNLTERRFRSYWERTTSSNERQRFAEVKRRAAEVQP